MFLLQKENVRDFLDVEYSIWKRLLKESKRPFVELSLDELSSINKTEDFCNDKENIKEAIPLGTIEFTEEYFKKIHNIEQMNPIEIPPCLRTSEFLKREYAIVEGAELPKRGRFFVKNVDRLKDFVYIGDLSDLGSQNDFCSVKIDANSYYQLSEILDIQAEYRVYVLNGKIYSIAFYNGNPLLFPDTKLIQKANLIYSLQKDYPKSYTMDVAVTNRGTVLIELHTFFSCGLYQTVLGTDFLGGYIDALNYVIRHNTKLIKGADVN